MLPESMDELSSTIDPFEKDLSLGNSTLMVGCVCVSPITRRSRVGGEAGGVSLNNVGESESMLVLEDDPLRALEASRLHDPLMFVMDPLMFC